MGPQEHSGHDTRSRFRWAQLPDLPDPVGVAGAFAGMSNGALIVAGGANFPEGMPWEGGKKVYHHTIHVYRPGKSPADGRWQEVSAELPFPAGYGASVPLNNGLLCLGGNNADSCTRAVFMLRWDPGRQQIERIDYPDLPVPLTAFAAVELDGKIYVMGGQRDLSGAGAEPYFYRLDLSSPAHVAAESSGREQGHQTGASPQWERLPAWDGAPRSYPVAAVQHNGYGNRIYLFSGRYAGTDGRYQVLDDGWEYDPEQGDWKMLEGNGVSFPVMAGNALPWGVNNILFLGGAKGDKFRKAQALQLAVDSAQAELAAGDQQQQAENALLDFYTNHPGFDRSVRLYNTVTRQVTVIDSLPFPAQVTTPAVRYGNTVLIPSGEVSPGVRTPHIQLLRPEGRHEGLGWLNIGVLVVYFLVLTLIGWYFSTRQKSTDDYFKGGGRVPWWAAGISVFGTALSAITFMAIPAKTYATDWSYFMFNMGIILAAPVIVFLFVPFYRKLNITTAYEYLELRFNWLIRGIGSASFMLFQVGRMGVVLYLPAIALHTVTGIDIYFCILLVGVISILYTAIGGIEAVIWTDVMQVIVLLGGALFAIWIMWGEIPGGISGIIREGQEGRKFNILHTAFDLRKPVLWTVLVGSLFSNVVTYGTDQTIVQRYLTVKDQRAAAGSVWTNAFLTLPATILFFFIGTGLYVFYRHSPEKISLVNNNADAIFPWFIMTELPPGVNGLLIAAIFAAAMSTLSSSINSAATAYINDFSRRFNWTGAQGELKAARIASLVAGLCGVAFALFMATWEIASLWDIFSMILGLVLGSMGGVFLLGMLVKRAGSTAAMTGILVSIPVQFLVARYEPVHLLLYTATGVLSCFLAGWLVSFVKSD